MIDYLLSLFQKPENEYEPLPGYMKRWWVYRVGHTDHVYADGRKAYRYAARIHEILRSDADRDLHNHPMNYMSIILKGGYWEVTWDDKYNCFARRWYGPGSILIRKADHFHRLILPEGKTCTTLFIVGRWRQSWGFATEGGFVHWTQYNSLKNPETK